MVINKKIVILILLLYSFKIYSQKKKVNPELALQATSAKISEDCRTKSLHLSVPNIISINRQNLEAAKTVKEILDFIPQTCEVICTVFSITSSDDKIFQFINFGNDIVYHERLWRAKTILIENLNTSCCESHKANYRIIVQ